MQALIDYGQAAAAQEYANVNNRNLQAYTTNAGIQSGAQAQNFGQAYQGWQGQNSMGLAAQGANNNATQLGYQNAYQGATDRYNAAYNAFQNNQNNAFQRPYQVAQLGITAAGQQNTLGNAYANAYGNQVGGNAAAMGSIWGQQANSQAAGTQGAAQAWGNTLGNLGATAMAAYYQGQSKPTTPAQTTPYTSANYAGVGQTTNPMKPGYIPYGSPGNPIR